MWSMATPRRSGASLATGQSGICELSDARSLSGSSGYVPKLASILSNSTKMRSTSVSTARLSSPGVLVSTATPQSFERMGECMLNPAQPSSCYDCSNHASAGRHLPGRAVRGPRLLTVFHSSLRGPRQRFRSSLKMTAQKSAVGEGPDQRPPGR